MLWDTINWYGVNIYKHINSIGCPVPYQIGAGEPVITLNLNSESSACYALTEGHADLIADLA